MRAVPNDSPEPAWLHGDLLLQLCANHPDTIHHTIRDITKHTRGGMQLRWKIEGMQLPAPAVGHHPEPAGIQGRHGQPDWQPGQQPGLGAGPGRAALWARGGSYQVVRLIRMLVADYWDRVSINEQEGMFGRRRGADPPLDGNTEFDTPNYHADRHGNVIPLDAHIRLANPRTPATADQRLVRRSWAPRPAGWTRTATVQAGHIFVAYQQDLTAVRNRPGAAGQRAPSWTTCSRSAAATFTRCPAWRTPVTGTAGPC